jgi:Tol biopolymer transport system component
MKFDGSDVRRLIGTPASETCPSISPDGMWIAYYAKSATGTYTLQLAHADGTNSTTLASLRYPPECPLWSHSSDLVEVTDALSSGFKAPLDEATKIFAVSGALVASYNTSDQSLSAFSTDGTSLLATYADCSINGCTSPDIFIKQLNGSTRALTGTVGVPFFQSEGAQDPDLHPNGVLIVFACVDTATYVMDHICTINWDGSAKTRILGGAQGHPKFSPDGSRISFLCTGTKSFPPDLCVANLADKIVTHLASNVVFAPGLWTPDGANVVFECQTSDICITPSGVSAPVNLTKGQGSNVYPSIASALSH